jgi:opacity protein-like surface antigen
MRTLLIASLLLALASTAQAQDVDSNVSIPLPVPAGVENNVNTEANSNADADSASVSSAGAFSDQGQSQHQGQSATQGNAQSTSLVFEASKIPNKTTQNFKTNTAVPLAASVSFSSDYCGGVASGGASAAGISLGGSKPIMDRNCQSLRRAEKFGIAAANAHGAGMSEVAGKLIAMQVWEICMSEANVSEHRGSSNPSTQSACEQIGLLGDTASPKDDYAAVVRKEQEAAPYQEEPRAVIRGSDGRSVEVAPAPAFRN